MRLADALLDVWASLFEVLLVARDEDGLGDRLANVVTAATNALSDAARATFLLRAARAAPYEAAQTAACVLSNVDASGAALRVARCGTRSFFVCLFVCFLAFFTFFLSCFRKQRQAADVVATRRRAG